MWQQIAVYDSLVCRLHPVRMLNFLIVYTLRANCYKYLYVMQPLRVLKQCKPLLIINTQRADILQLEQAAWNVMLTLLTMSTIFTSLASYECSQYPES